MGTWTLYIAYLWLFLSFFGHCFALCDCSGNKTYISMAYRDVGFIDRRADRHKESVDVANVSVI